MVIARHGFRTVGPAECGQHTRGPTGGHSFARWAPLRCLVQLRSRHVIRLLLVTGLISFAASVLAILTHICTTAREPEIVVVHELKIANPTQVRVNDTAHHNDTSRLDSTKTSLNREGDPKHTLANVTTPTVADTHRNFSEKYRHHYVNNTKEFFSRLEEIIKHEWKPNEDRQQQFRNDLRRELGANGSLDNFIVTKKNTPVGAKLGFYMQGKPQRVHPTLRQNIPNDAVYGSGQFQSCSVVGSSGILKGSGCGQQIDRSQSVFRFNVAPVVGFDTDVGRKTNFTTLNPSLVINRLNSLKTKSDIDQLRAILEQFRGSLLWLPAFAVAANTAVITRVSHNAFSSTLVKPVLGHPQHFLSVSKLWREIVMDSHTWPTTGLYLILSLIDVCEQINIFGYWPYETTINGSHVPYHYHNNITAMHSVHSFDTEFKYLVSLHEQGIINMGFGSCV